MTTENEGMIIMANMSYCRFENTMDALQDCYDHMADDISASETEPDYRYCLIELCKRIAEEYGSEGR